MEQVGSAADALLRVVAAVAMVAVSVTDLRSRRIPDAVTLPALLAVVALALIGAPSGVTAPGAALIGAVAFGLPLAAIAWMRPEAMGMGDAKLAALIGASVGALDLPLLPATVVGGVLLGGVVASVAWIRGGDRTATIAFGPPLALAALVALVLA